jgi:hypothetical protein
VHIFEREDFETVGESEQTLTMQRAFAPAG